MKISVITATFNNQDCIKSNLESYFSQDYQDKEHIIIDGLSTDNTLDIIKENGDADIIISEKDNGLYDALNKGIKYATGDIIVFLHADDVFDSSHTLSDAIKILMDNNADSVYGDLQYVSKNDINKIIRHWKSKEYSIKKFKNGWMPPHPTFFCKKEIYNKFGNFDTNFKIAADYDLVLRFLYKNKVSTSYCPKVITRMRVGGKSNKSLKNIIQKTKEDLKACRNNGIFGPWAVFFKNFRKIKQFFMR